MVERNPHILIGMLKGQISETAENNNLLGSAANRMLETVEELKEAIAAREQDIRDGKY